MTITVKDSASPQNSAQTTLSLNVAPASSGPLTITSPTGTLPGGTQGAPYGTVNLVATGGTGPYSFQASGLPAGLMVAGSTITGTPTEIVTRNVILQVTDSAGSQARVNLTITIGAPIIQCTPINVTSTNVGQNLQTLVTVTLSETVFKRRALRDYEQ